MAHSSALRLLRSEARALLTRLAWVRPFALHMPMVMAAAVSREAQTAMECYLASKRRELRSRVHEFLRWLKSPEARRATPADAQRRFTFLRLRFNAVLTQFDIFSDVLTQRSEHDNGVWLSGLDAFAADVLSLPGRFLEAPPVVCYLDRGVGAAIRRARTRLPGGDENPIAIIRVPRERMVGSTGMASSVAHEVGHQGSVLLDLLTSMRLVLQQKQRETKGTKEQRAWVLYERWISEILADFWSVAKVGVASTLGLIGVVSLPRAFVFRVALDDPHPIPWIRVKLSCAMGRVLYPHPQYDQLAALWESFYPLEGLDAERRELFAVLVGAMPAFISLLVNHRPQALKGKSLGEVMVTPERQPAQLAAQYDAWRVTPAQMRTTQPALAFAVIGQARADGKLTPEEEARLVAGLLTHWAMQTSLDSSLCPNLHKAGAGTVA